MNNQEYPACPKCKFISLITDETVDRPDGVNVKVRICMKKNCSTLWIPHVNDDFVLLIHSGKQQLLAEEYRAKNTEAVEGNNTLST